MRWNCGVVGELRAHVPSTRQSFAGKGASQDCAADVEAVRLCVAKRK